MSDTILQSRPVFRIQGCDEPIRGEWSGASSFELEQEIINQFHMTGFFFMHDKTENGMYVNKYNVVTFTVEEKTVRK